MGAIRHYASGLVVFRMNSGARNYLIIQHSAGHWEFPKGHIEPGETLTQTARRELAEETGIDNAELIPGFAREIRYLYRDRKNRLIHKLDTFGLARIESDIIRLSREHLGFAFLNFHAALNRLTHAGTRAVLRDAEDFLMMRTGRAPDCPANSATMNQL